MSTTPYTQDGTCAENEMLHEKNVHLINEQNGKERVAEGDQEEEVDEIRGECGFLGCKPSFLQPCAQPFSFVIAYSISALMTSTLSTYVNSQVTTLERQFGFNSSQTGLIMAANDIGYLSTCIIFSYLAVRMNIPRTLGILTIFFGVSGIICSMPHFFFGSRAVSDDVNATLMMSPTKEAVETFGQLCLAEAGNTTAYNCAPQESKSQTISSIMREHSQTALGMIVIGMIIQGICKSPRWPYAIYYVDTNLKDKMKTGFYLGIVVALAIFGPVLGFVLGGVFTRMYVTLEDTKLTPKHPRWIGAWWMGFVVFGATSVFSAVPLFLFPEWLRGKKPQFSLKEKSATTTSVTNMRTKIMHELKDFLSAVRRLVTNPVYVCFVAASCSNLFSVGGLQAFLPKYIEVQFSLPTWRVNLILAASSMSAASLGTFIGGWLTRRFKMTPITGIKVVFCFQMVGLVATVFGFFLKCPQPTVLNRPDDISTTASCIDDCSCDGAEFLPVCSSDYHTYYSPCHAGCLTALDEVHYSNCSCIADGAAKAGVCDYSCYHFYIFIAIQVATAFFGTMTIMSKMIAFIRTVSPQDKAFAMGCSSFMTSLLGWLLGPVIFGKMIDGVCDVWESTCSGRGSCLLYDNDSFRVRLHTLVMAGRASAAVFIGLAFVAAKFTKILDNVDPNQVEAGPGKSQPGKINPIIAD